MSANERGKAVEPVESHSLEGSRACDERGWALFPWQDREMPIDPATVHVVQVTPGATRGNHTHPRVSEWLCPLEGEGLLVWREPGGEVQELRIKARTACFRIRPGVAHAVTNVGPGQLILLAARERDPEGDLSVPEKVV